MGAFIGREDGERLLKTLETGITADRKRPNMFPQAGENPLYEFKSGKNGNGYDYPVMYEIFDLLKQNKYGSSYVAKTDDIKTTFRQGLGSRDPSWIENLGMQDLDKLIYFINSEVSKGIVSLHYIPDRLCDGTFHTIVKRSMELGSFEKPAPSMQQAASAPPRPQFN